jgi:hypothetical protein
MRAQDKEKKKKGKENQQRHVRTGAPDVEVRSVPSVAPRGVWDSYNDEPVISEQVPINPKALVRACQVWRPVSDDSIGALLDPCPQLAAVEMGNTELAHRRSPLASARSTGRREDRQPSTSSDFISCHERCHMSGERDRNDLKDDARKEEEKKKKINMSTRGWALRRGSLFHSERGFEIEMIRTA